MVLLRVALPVLRTEFVLGVVALVRVAGVAVSRVPFVLLLGRTASRVPFVRVVPRVAVEVFGLDAARVVVAVRPLVVRLVARAVVASATRAGRADVRVLRSTSGR